MALSKNKLKYIKSLKDKKKRTEYNTFVAEGNKMVSELLSHLQCQLLVATDQFIATANLRNVDEVVTVTEEELEQASFLKTPQQVLGVFYQPEFSEPVDLEGELVIALDGIQDPGNMGTIIRLADWYGIKNIFCSSDTVDIYNIKVVQATMGALARVNVHYVDLESFLDGHKYMIVYGTSLNGENIYKQELSATGILVMGNE